MARWEGSRIDLGPPGHQRAVWTHHPWCSREIRVGPALGLISLSWRRPVDGREAPSVSIPTADVVNPRSVRSLVEQAVSAPLQERVPLRQGPVHLDGGDLVGGHGAVPGLPEQMTGPVRPGTPEVTGSTDQWVQVSQLSHLPATLALEFVQTGSPSEPIFGCDQNAFRVVCSR